MRKIGWYGESYRHALSARGISNRRFSYAYVANTRKGNRTSPFDIKIINPKTGKAVDLKKSLQARGIKTTGGRDYRKVGDQIVPDIGPVLAPTGDIMSMGPAFTEEELTGIPSQVHMETIESAVPTALASYGLEQQAQQVEGSIPFEEQSQVGSAPLSYTGGQVIPQQKPSVVEEVEGREVSKSGLIEVPEVGTTDVFEPGPMDMERH